MIWSVSVRLIPIDSFLQMVPTLVGNIRQVWLACVVDLIL